MITHENTDISIAAVGLLHEMTDVDTILEVEEAMILIDTFLDSQGKIGLIYRGNRPNSFILRSCDVEFRDGGASSVRTALTVLTQL